MKIVFSTKGGQPKEIELTKFLSADGAPVKLLDPSAPNHLSYAINTGSGSSQVAELYFREPSVDKNADGSQVITFNLPAPQGESITHQFILHPDSYLVDFNILSTNPSKLFTQNAVNINWQSAPVVHEKDAVYERRQSQVCIVSGDDFDYYNVLSKTEHKFEKPIEWISVKQQFFNTALIAKQKFTTGGMTWTHPTDSTVVTAASADLQLSITPAPSVSIPLQLYYGPNDYKILKGLAINDMDKIINLGQGFYSFVRPINKYIIMPVFNFFKNFITSYGVVILLLTLFIRLLTSPLVYSSYLSGAKMKALRPEIEEMKKRVGNDQQQVGVEQMKLFREAGVNPLGGCIPALLQIPIFFALYSFFNSNME